MKRILLSATGCLTLLASVTQAQVQPCNTYRMQEIHTKNIPGYKEKLDAANAEMAANYQAYLTKAAQRTSNVIPASYTFTIPVVFHILHMGGSENISDADCITALNYVNKDYARLGSDTSTIDPLYDTAYINSRIHFELAKKDPLGNCTNGIVRHYDANTNWQQGNALFNYIYSGYGGTNWSPSKYLNIYVVKSIIDDGNSAGTIIGYTYLPGTSPNYSSDAIVYTGSGNWLTNMVAVRSLSHEIGHWLGLSHTFGSNNNAGVMCGNDDIADTPRTSGFFSTCPLPYTALNDSCDPGKRPNINNIMDYSGCPKMFTRGQVAKMRGTLENSIANRDLLVDTANLIATGILDANFNHVATTPCAPVADFAANKVNLCNGQSANYVSTSYNFTNPVTYAWEFEGGTPATSSNASQIVTYSMPGIYGTTLTITNTEGTSTKSVSQYNHVYWNSDTTSFPYVESFENGINFPDWYVTNKDFGSITWQIGNYGSQGSSHCLMLPNANGGYFFGDVDIIESRQFNFTNTSGITISYDYSYAKKTGTTQDTIKFQYSTDCGGSWINVPGMPSAAVMAASGGTLTAPYVPWTQSKWVNKVYSSALLGALNNKQDVKFRFYFKNDRATGSAQNLYIDNINISGVVGIEELANTIGLSIFPNPTNASSTIEFTSPVDSRVYVTVNDVTGRLVEQNQFNAAAGHLTTYSVNQSGKLQSGVYFVTLSLDGQKVTKKLIVE
jgi:hypothetical protein